MLKYAIPALALIFVGACGNKDDETGDSGDTDVTGDDDDDETDTSDPPEDPIIDVVATPGCDGGTWVYYAETAGWTSGENLVNAWEAGAPSGSQWNEEHDLLSIDYDENGWWDILEQTLTPGVAFDQYQPNSNTLYTCDVQGSGGSNVYTIRVYDVDGNYSDCAIFSDGVPNGVADVFAGEVDETNPVTARSEISAANCAEWTVSR